jgi:Ca2+-binding RTX toxin-like protein
VRRFAFAGLSIAVLAGIIFAFAASNTVPGSRLTDQAFYPGANDYKPPECAGLNLTNLVAGDGVLNGTKANDLILAGAGNDKLQGKNGDDCLVGGGGDDELTGNNGWDICLGGGGTDTFKQCEVEIQ